MKILTVPATREGSPALLPTAGATGVAKKDVTQSSTACNNALLPQRGDTTNSAPTVTSRGQQVPATLDAEQFTHAHPSCASIERPPPLPSKDRQNSGVGQVSCDTHTLQTKIKSLKQGKGFPHPVMSPLGQCGPLSVDRKDVLAQGPFLHGEWGQKTACTFPHIHVYGLLHGDKPQLVRRPAPKAHSQML